MQNERLQRLKSLFEVLHSEAEELLVQKKIWSVSSYGWEDEDTPDAEYIGIAMWAVHPPFELDFRLFEGQTPEHCPTKREKILLQNGEDLMAMMVFARRSLGMTLCFAAVADPNVAAENDHFWQEYSTTLMWLNIAADRLRDFYLMARFGETKTQFNKRYKRENNTKEDVPYSAPFKADAKEVESNLSECLVKLAQLAENLQEHRKERNDRVHEIASITAQRSVDLLVEQQRLTGMQRNATRATFHDEALQPAVEKMVLWFDETMKAASRTFEFEYFSRIKQ